MKPDLADDHYFSSEAAAPDGVCGTDLEVIESDAGPLYMPLDDEVMREYIAHRGTWEPEIGRFLLGALGGFRKPVFIDVGANVGYFSRFVTRHMPQVSVHAFEPHPQLVPILRLNAWSGGGRVRVWPLALSGGDRTVVLQSSEHNIGDTRSSRPTQGQSVSIAAPAARFDDLFTGTPLVHVVKVDVQGFEHLVVEGMMSTLRRSRGVQVVVEFGLQMLEAAETSPIEVLRVYRRMGLDVLWLHREGLRSESDQELVRAARSGGPDGQLNLVLRWPGGGRR